MIDLPLILIIHGQLENATPPLFHMASNMLTNDINFLYILLSKSEDYMVILHPDLEDEICSLNLSFPSRQHCESQ